MKIEILDTTLRDGEQGAGVYFTGGDKCAVAEALTALGVDIIEAGSILRGSRDAATDGVFSRAVNRAVRSRLAAFTMTARPYCEAESDAELAAAAASDIMNITVVGKSAAAQVENVLGCPADENLNMIRRTCEYLSKAGKRVIFDAEHFFDGYSDDAEYSMSALEAAFEGGADTAVLCDTNGGALPDVVGMVTAAAVRRFQSKRIGIHCHNDLGMAVAATVEAALSGATHIQGSISGIGERCGNANLCTLIPLLQLKMGFECVPPASLATLTAQARRINELANLTFNENEPFVGGYAFAHKAGMHIDGVFKSPRNFEHIDPALVGNTRNTLISALSGRAAIRDRLSALRPDLTKDSPEVTAVLESIRRSETLGYQYENAEASLSLVIRGALGMRRSYYDILSYQITINETASGGESASEVPLCTSLIKIKVGDAIEIAGAEGIGPVNAFDLALRKALLRFYPRLDRLKLIDYRVRVLGPGDATASTVRVFVESTDGVSVWRTIGVSADIVDASRQALCDAVDYMLTNGEM